jgi:VanZ family protein
MTTRRSLLPRAIAWAIVILVLCAIPSSAIPVTRVTIPGADKLVHFLLFLVMGFLARGELRERARLGTWPAFALSLLACTAYGGMIEILQENFFHRGGEWLDLLADTAGAIAGNLARLPLERGKKRN